VSSIVVSICAVISLDYFFIPPLFRLQIGDPIHLAAFLTYSITAVIVTYLASNVRREERNARRHEKELQLLFSAASQVLAVEPEAAGARCPTIFREVFGFKAVCLVQGAGEVRQEGESQWELAAQTREAYYNERGSDDRARGISLRTMNASGRVTGAIGLEGSSFSPWVAGAISVLASATYERARHLQQAVQSVAESRAEALRSAILDAFAHEFKTPLTAIMAAAGSLGEIGPLNASQSKLADTVEEQSAWLGKLTTRLLRAARLDREEVKPKLEETDLGSLVSRIVASRGTQPENSRLQVTSSAGDVLVMADPELLTLGLVPVLDSAVRYSNPDTPVDVSIESRDGWATMRIAGHGSSPRNASDRGLENVPRDRFGDAGQKSGSELYISRKILKAHGGDIVLKDDSGVTGEVTFDARIPLAEKESGYARRAS